MSDYTTNLNLLKKDPEADGNDYFNIQTMLNDNWDKIDAGVAAKETPAGAQAKVDNLAGAGRTTQTVKGNADAITALNQTVVLHSAEDASTSAKGHVQLATNAEVTTGANTTKAVTPAGVKVELDKKANISHTQAFSTITGTVPISQGGTGQTTAALARNALGLGNTTGALPIANGGTGATTAAAALTNLGITATAAELNYTDGVTSNIQTQLNVKLGLGGGTMSGEVNHADNLVTRPNLKDYAEQLGITPATTGTVNFDLTTGNVFAVTPTGAITIGAVNPPASGRCGSATIWLTNGATVYTKTFAATIKWVNDEIPDTSEPSKTYGIVLTTLNGGTTYRAACIGAYSA